MGVVSTIQPKVSRLVNYMRNPTWISPNFAFDPAKGIRNFAYSEEEKAQFRSDPEAFFKYRKELEAR